MQSADLVYQKTSTAGIENISLSDIAGYRSFSSAFLSSDSSNPFFYFMRHKTINEWEIGQGYIDGSGLLVRMTILKSSNNDQKVSFSAGLKDVTNDFPASVQESTFTQFQTQGAPSYISGATYRINALVRYNDVVYRSKSNGNTALPTDTNFWSSAFGVIDPTQGGTGLSTYNLGDTIFASAANTLAKLAGNILATKKFLSQVGNGTISAAPVWAQPDFTDLTGTAGAAQGGTGQSSYSIGDTLYASGATALTRLAGNTANNKRWLLSQGNGTVASAPVWAQPAFADISGIVAASQGGAGAVTGVLKANGSGVVSAAAAGTDFVIPGAAPANGVIVTESLLISCSDLTTALTVGAAKSYFTMPYALTASAFKINVLSPPTGANLIVNIKKNGTTIFSTNISIDANESSSTTAATPYVLAVNPTTFAADDIVTFDIVQVGSTFGGAGLITTIIGHQ